MVSDFSLLFSSIALLIVGIGFFVKDNFSRLQHILNALFILLTVQFLQKDIQPIENSLFMTGIIGVLIGVNLLFSSFLIKNKFRWGIPIVSIILLLFIGKNDFLYKGYSLNLSDLKITGLIFLGFVSGVISISLKFILKRFFVENDSDKIQSIAQILLIGLFMIPATFFASWYGIIFLSSGYFLFSCYHQGSNNNNNTIIPLLAIASVSSFLTIYHIENIDLSVGKVIAGLILGSGAYFLGVLASKSSNKFVGLGLIFLGILTIGLITILNNIHPAYGGVESFSAALVGMALGGLLFGNSSISVILYPAFLIIGLTLPSDPFESIGNKENVVVNSTGTKEEKAVVEEPKGLDASVLSGKYIIVPETANLSFQLGPKGGVTKGAILNFEGTVNFGNSIETTKFNVKLPTKKLTTFNSMRDESVLGGAYLNAEKYPLMSFNSSNMEKKDDGYILKGNFTLLGKTNPEDVFIKYLGEKDGKQQFFGKAAIDRTKYGMLSSPQEGNVVDFTFTIELK
jgi:polyisoprenoid-binding protein YceI